MERSLIAEIEQEFQKVDARWLTLHFRISVGLVILAFVVECGLSLLINSAGEIHLTPSRYFLKYLIVPAGLNSVCILIEAIVLGLPKVSQTAKIYVVSLMFVEICFILFTIHGVFTALFFLFAGAILLTTIYAHYSLTTATSLYSFALLIFSELFLRWDPDKPLVSADGMRLTNFLIAVFFLVGFYLVCMVIIYFEKLKNAASVRKEIERLHLQRKLLTDELTGINNRLGFRNAIKDMEEDFSGTEYVFALIDLDHFKSLNDELGHLVGDRCLSGFAKILADECGEETAFRYGGDEFCLLFRGKSLSEVLEACRVVQSDFLQFSLRPPFSRPMTASFGIARYETGMPPSTLISNSDQALYASKANRGSITVYGESSGATAE